MHCVSIKTSQLWQATDKRKQILIIFGKQHQHTFKNMYVCMYVCMYVKSQDDGDVSAGAQQGHLTMS